MMRINNGVLKQCGKVLLRHLLITAVITLFALAAFWWFIEQAVWKQVFSIVCTLLYFSVMASCAQRIAEHDGRDWSPEKAYPQKGFLFALVLVAATFLLWALYFFTWNFLTIDNSIYGGAGTVYNIIFMVWTFPFNGLMGLYQGYMMWYGHVLIYAVPALSMIVGYLLGYRKIRVTERLEALMYEKEKD